MNSRVVGPISRYVGLLKSQRATLDRAFDRDYLAGCLVQEWPELVSDEVTADGKLKRTWDRNWSILCVENGWHGKRIWTRRDRRCFEASPGETCQQLRASAHDQWLDNGNPRVGSMYERALDPKWIRRRKLLVHFIRRRGAFEDFAQDAIRFVGQRQALAAIPLVQDSLRLHRLLLGQIWNGQQMQNAYSEWWNVLGRLSDYATALETPPTDVVAIQQQITQGLQTALENLAVRDNCGESAMATESASQPGKDDEPTTDTGGPAKLAGRQAKPAATVNDRMAGTIMTNPDAMGWKSPQWEKYLKCARSTVVDTETWKKLKSARLRTQAERMKDRRRKPKASDSQRD